jgi:tripartite-type tricarboxylate transporter receptor subunit TctC
MQRMLQLFIAAVTVVGLMVSPDSQAFAQSFPTKPIRFIVPFPPGGATDIVSRAMQPQLEKLLGQTVVIENRPGAGAVLGVDAVAKAAPDGHTIGIGPAGALSVNTAMQVKMPFDVRKDLAAVSNIAETPFILAAATTFNATSLADVIAQAKAAPGTLSIGHGGNGTSMYFTALLFTTMANVQIGLVPYRGTQPVVTDLLGGHIGLGIVDAPPARAAIHEGKMKALAVSSKERFPFFPEIPTFDEQGVKGYEVTGWFGLVAPAATPAEIIAKLNAAVVATLKHPEVTERIRAVGMEPKPTAAADFKTFIDTEIDKIAKVLAQSGGPPPQ